MTNDPRYALDALGEMITLFRQNNENLEQLKELTKELIAKPGALQAIFRAQQERAQKSRPSSDKDDLHCSFCGKSQLEVKKLIAGPTVFICDECIVLCMGIIGEPEDTEGP